jgi:hypothetical protein
MEYREQAARRAGVTTPLGAIAGGMAAAAVGTLAMDTYLYARYRSAGGKQRFRDWELSSGTTTWESAAAPAIVGKRILEGLFDRRLPDERAALVNNTVHWGWGVGAGALFGVVAGSLPMPRRRHGLVFGASVWAGSYVVLPAAGLYEPIWRYKLGVLGNDLTAHLIYGLSTAVAFRQLWTKGSR